MVTPNYYDTRVTPTTSTGWIDTTSTSYITPTKVPRTRRSSYSSTSYPHTTSTPGENREKYNKAIQAIRLQMKIDQDKRAQEVYNINPLGQELPCMQPIFKNHKINSKR